MKHFGPLFISTAFVAFCFFASSAWANHEEHTVASGETLSAISFKYLGGPIYSESGSLAQVLRMNPGLHNPNLILPGQIIVIDDRRMQDRFEMTSPELSEVERPPEPEKEPGPKGRWSLLTGFEYFKIESKDLLNNSARSEFVSEISPRLGLAWQSPFTERWAFLASGSYTFESFLDGDSQQLEVDSPGRWDFATGVQFETDESSRISALVRIRQRRLPQSKDATTIFLKNISLPSLRLSYDRDFFQRESLSLGAGIVAEYLLSSAGAGHQLNAGRGLEARVFLRKVHKQVLLDSALYYGEEVQSSNLVAQKENHLGVSLNLGWSFE